MQPAVNPIIAVAVEGVMTEASVSDRSSMPPSLIIRFISTLTPPIRIKVPHGTFFSASPSSATRSREKNGGHRKARQPHVEMKEHHKHNHDRDARQRRFLLRGKRGKLKQMNDMVGMEPPAAKRHINDSRIDGHGQHAVHQKRHFHAGKPNLLAKILSDNARRRQRRHAAARRAQHHKRCQHGGGFSSRRPASSKTPS